jgi:hypothetical protein
VLHDIEKPFAALIDAARVVMVHSKQDPVLPLVAAPETPVTPVSAAGFAVLQDTIIRGDSCALDEVNKRNLERHVGKLAKAGQVSLARTALQEDHIRFLLKTNDEAKPRRFTRSIVLGIAKVMSYEDLTDARAKRVEQEEKASARRQKLKEARAKRTEQEENGNVSKSRKQTSVRKCKVRSSRPRDPNTGSEASRANEETGPVINATQTANANWVGGPIAPCPGRAPTAQMW